MHWTSQFTLKEVALAEADADFGRPTYVSTAAKGAHVTRRRDGCFDQDILVPVLPVPEGTMHMWSRRLLTVSRACANVLMERLIWCLNIANRKRSVSAICQFSWSSETIAKCNRSRSTVLKRFHSIDPREKSPWSVCEANREIETLMASL